MTPKARSFAERALRKASLRWAPRNITKELAKVEEGEYTIQIEGDSCWVKYECASCGGIFRASECEMDHIECVVPIEGNQGLEVYAERLFVPVNGWACLCIGCHNIKTTFEDLARTDYARELKEKGMICL